MRKILKTVTAVILLSICMPHSGNAQILKRLQDKVEERVDRKLNEKERKGEQKVDKEIDKALDTPENAVKNSNKEDKKEKSKATSKAFKLPNQYTFNYKVVYEIKNKQYKKGNTITYWFSENDDVFGFEMDESTFMVYDMQQDAILMIMEKDKIIQVLPSGMMAAFSDAADQDDNQETPQLVRKPNGDKVIAGYKCEHYEMESNDMDVKLWFSREVDVKLDNFAKAFAGAAKGKQKMPKIDAANKGFMMAMNSTEKKNKDVNQMTAVEVGKKQKVIIASQYKTL